MCDRPAPVSALCPRIEIVTISLVMLGLAKKNNNNQKEDEHSGVLVSWRFTTLAKQSFLLILAMLLVMFLVMN